SLELDGVEWTRAHPRAARRLMRVSGVWGVAIAGASALVIGWWSVAVVSMLGIRAVLRARGIAAHLGCAIVGDRIAFRGGWLHRIVSVVRFERIQSAVFGQTLFDRRSGMAAVGVDTAGMGQGELTMPYLPESVALNLHARLTEAAVRTPFTW
ncbi:MAG: PH domain-containing protein, partial [Gemmatimonadaceae bacterium]